MIAYNCDLNVILACPFSSRKYIHRFLAYNTIMERLKICCHHVDLQVLDNEASTAYRRQITDKWKADFQLVPSNIHRRNTAERAIRTFKAHFLAILAGVAPDYPRNLWDLLIPQTEITLNMLIQARLNHAKSAWEAFDGPLNYDATPLGPLGCEVISHKKMDTRNSWDFIGEPAWNIRVSLKHYRCQNIIAKENGLQGCLAHLSSDTITSPYQPGHQRTTSYMGSKNSLRLLVLSQPWNLTIN